MFGLIKKCKYDELKAAFDDLNNQMASVVKEHKELTLKFKALKGDYDALLKSNHDLMSEKNVFLEDRKENVALMSILLESYELVDEVKTKHNSAFKYKNVKKLYKILDEFVNSDLNNTELQ